jgi:hypothetical protein
MPEINPFKKDFVKNISDKKNDGSFLDSRSFEKIAADFGVKKIGAGTECFVTEDPDSKEKVIAINYKNLSPEDAKDLYYSSKIWSTLFPHNFPKIHAASAEIDENKFNGTVREKIDGKTLHEHGYSFNQMIASDFKEKKLFLSIIMNIKNYISNKTTRAQYPFSTTYEEMKILSHEPYNLPFFIDTNTHNFIKTDNGDEYYVDTMRMGSRLTNQVNIEAVEYYMRERNYKDSDISRVTNSLSRLKDIFLKDDK